VATANRYFLITIPLTIQTYFIFVIACYGGKKIGLPYQVCAPGSMIGASNFFKLAVAVAIALFGLQLSAALVKYANMRGYSTV
jgi:ACR3 family arsenite transporter